MSDERLTRWRCEVRRVIPAADDDLVEEVAQHAADRWAALRSAGHDPQECDARALREIADWQSVPVPVRLPQLTAARLWAGWAHNVRYSARTLRLHPMFSGGVTLLTAIAVAACVVAFTIVYGVFWRPAAVPEADRLVVLWQVGRGAGPGELSGLYRCRRRVRLQIAPQQWAAVARQPSNRRVNRARQHD